MIKKTTEELLQKNTCFCKSKDIVIPILDCRIPDCKFWKKCCEMSWKNCKN